MPHRAEGAVEQHGRARGSLQQDLPMAPQGAARHQCIRSRPDGLCRVHLDALHCIRSCVAFPVKIFNRKWENEAQWTQMQACYDVI